MLGHVFARAAGLENEREAFVEAICPLRTAAIWFVAMLSGWQNRTRNDTREA